MISVGGAAVLSGRIDLPLSGRWTALLRLDTPTAASGAVTIDCDGGLRLVGAVARARAHLDACEAWIVGGAGGVQGPAALVLRNAFARDVLSGLTRATGEALDSSIPPALLTVPLPRWDAAGSATSGLTALAQECARQLGAPVHWRFLSGGRLWMGAEAWPTAALADHEDVLDEWNEVGVSLVGGETPTLLPGIDVAGIGRIAHVTHRIEPSKVRSEVTRWS